MPTPAMKYLLEYNGRAAFVEMLRGDSSEYYGTVQNAFRDICGGQQDRFAYVSMTRMDDIETANGVPFTWELAGSQGAAFELLALPGITPQQIADAKSALRRSRDVVRTSVRHVKELVAFEQPARAASLCP